MKLSNLIIFNTYLTKSLFHPELKYNPLSRGVHYLETTGDEAPHKFSFVKLNKGLYFCVCTCVLCMDFNTKASLLSD